MPIVVLFWDGMGGRVVDFGGFLMCFFVKSLEVRMAWISIPSQDASGRFFEGVPPAEIMSCHPGVDDCILAGVSHFKES